VTTSDTPAQTDLVIFDLDGTITRRDTLWGYVLGFALRQPWRLLCLVTVVPALLAFALGRADHGQLKSALIRSVMRNTPRSEIENWTRQYIPQLLKTGVFFNALRQIEQHRAAGDHLVLMTATVDLYVPKLAQALGFDGNSAPDLPHLRLADRAVLINAGSSLRQMATESQFEFRQWQ
jgi:phosphatidylglycerophosphatase C